LVGVVIWAVLLLVAVFSEGGLSWRSVGAAAVILAVLAVVTPVVMVLTETFRKSMRPPEG
jgi:hypothetical protein